VGTAAAAFRFDDEAEGAIFELGLNAVWLGTLRTALGAAARAGAAGGAAAPDGAAAATVLADASGMALLAPATLVGRFGGAILVSSFAVSVADAVLACPAGRVVDDVVGAVPLLPILSAAIWRASCASELIVSDGE
jgi:hypothetical protein